MFFRRRASKGPVTLVARWVRAGALRESQSVQDEMREELDRTQWPNLEPVLSEAFRLAIQAAYAPGNQVPDVPDYVQAVREHYESQGELNFTQAEGEILVRAARGEDVPISEVSGGPAMAVCGLFFVDIVRDLGYGKAEIDAMLVKAEELAAAGAHEPLISEFDRNARDC